MMAKFCAKVTSYDCCSALLSACECFQVATEVIGSIISTAKPTTKTRSLDKQVKQINRVKDKKSVQNSADPGYRFVNAGLKSDW